jgi:hypothetical protein
MSSTSRLPGAAGALRLGGSFLVCAAFATGLLVLGRPAAALGVGCGLAMHLANALFLYLTLASLASRGTTGSTAAIAGLSSVGRVLLLGLVLWWILTAWGRETALGAGGGLALAQISLFFRRSGAMGGV